MSRSGFEIICQTCRTSTEDGQEILIGRTPWDQGSRPMLKCRHCGHEFIYPSDLDVVMTRAQLDRTSADREAEVPQ